MLVFILMIGFVIAYALLRRAIDVSHRIAIILAITIVLAAYLTA